ncbi:MAG: cyanoexosortase B system-associated protein [Cyanobacteria bacterium J06614_10]
MSFSTLPDKLTKKATVKLMVIVALALFVAVSALPRYVSSWPWSSPLKVQNQPALQAIRDQGLTLSGWQVDDQVKTKIGGDTWSIQQLSATDQAITSETASTIFLLLRPQVWEADQPEVEWLDLKGSQQWETDSRQSLPIEVAINRQENPKTVRINTDFFRAWSKDQTYAILQWYAWPTGGSPSPAGWFWADQRTQWQHRQRMPWVAVSVWLPIEPLGDITPHIAAAKSLGQSVQLALSQTVFPEALLPS